MNERGLDLLSAGQCLLRSDVLALEAAGKRRRQKVEGVTWDHPSLYRIQVANDCILRTLWLNKALLCPTSPYPAGGTPSPTTFLDRCFRTEVRHGSPWGLLSSC